MTFQLLRQEELRTEYYVFTQFRLLHIPRELAGQPHAAVIGVFMNSPFHLWQGEEFPEGFSVTWTWERDGKMVTEDVQGVKVFGPYDLRQLSPTDYQLLDQDGLESAFFGFMAEHTHNDTDYLEKVRQQLTAFLTGDAWSVYRLHVSSKDDETKRSPYLDVFSFFTSLLAINMERGELLLVEFGQD